MPLSSKIPENFKLVPFLHLNLYTTMWLAMSIQLPFLSYYILSLLFVVMYHLFIYVFVEWLAQFSHSLIFFTHVIGEVDNIIY